MIIFRWKNTTNAEKLTISLISINTLVFVAWQFPKCHSFLSKHFTHSPIKNRPYTMLTATFSHENFLHFTFNMIALNSFLPLFQYSSGISNEQTLFFYLSAGVLSSLGSHLLSVFMPARAIVSSLGASGAIWGLLAACTYLRPQSQLGIVFLPGVHFRADEVLPLMMLVDAVGLVMRWQTFDHAAHLAGAIIGLIYVPYGIPFWSQVQTRLFNERRRSEEGGEYRK
ncbi:hypothetical protein BC833DRAFT_614837 [Globomyces pollinis-pini]|nr:hypothetical protein BC833DRAFT_614837 [Globomyces pollinis-pini]